MRQSSTVAAFLVRSHLSGLEALGVDAESVCARAGVRREQLHQTGQALSYDLSERLWCASAEITGDEAIGVHVAELLRPEQFDILGYVACNSADLGQAIARLMHYGRLLGTRFGVHLEIEGDEAVFSIAPVWAKPLVHYTTECILVGLLLMARRLTGTELPLTEARFRHSRPADTTDLERHMGTNLRFDAPHDGLVFPASYLKLPFQGCDAQLGNILERQAQDVLRSLDGSCSLTDRVRKLLAEELAHGNSNAEHIASRLCTSVRTLSRRLSEEGTSHQALLDQVRYELASRYLTNSQVEVADVAYLLGFADTSSFNRAFKRWSGTTPTAYRR